MPSLRNILRGIRKELREKEKAREKIQKDMRKATSLSKQAILLIHQKRLTEAQNVISKATKIISKATKIISMLNDASTNYPSIIYGGLFNIALQEYSEANIFLRLIEESRFITPKEINVPSIDYVLGLADVIGEYRRMTLDALREGDVKKSEKCLEIMDEIYVELMAMDEAYMLVSGLRRKCDVARKIIEATRGDVTQEVRRNSLEKFLKRFEKLAKKRR